MTLSISSNNSPESPSTPTSRTKFVPPPRLDLSVIQKGFVLKGRCSNPQCENTAHKVSDLVEYREYLQKK